MKITIEINTDGAAFDDAPTEELANVISDAILKLENMPVDSAEILYDTNGNRCGQVTVTS